MGRDFPVQVSILLSAGDLARERICAEDSPVADRGSEFHRAFVDLDDSVDQLPTGLDVAGLEVAGRLDSVAAVVGSVGYDL